MVLIYVLVDNEIEPWGFPTESSECFNLKKLIGGTKKKPEEKGYHKMFIRKGHYRIFKNIEEKMKEFNRFGDTDEYKRKVIDPLLNKSNFWIPKLDKITFIQKIKKLENYLRLVIDY